MEIVLEGGGQLSRELSAWKLLMMDVINSKPSESQKKKACFKFILASTVEESV